MSDFAPLAGRLRSPETRMAAHGVVGVDGLPEAHARLRHVEMSDNEGNTPIWRAD